MEAYRQQIFVNVRDGILAVFLVMDENRIEVSDPSLRVRPPLFRDKYSVEF
jgi:hypothetical protein